LHIRIGQLWERCAVHGVRSRRPPRGVASLIPVSSPAVANRAPSIPIRVLVCDPIAIRRAFIREHLDQDPGIFVVEPVADLNDVAGAAREAMPDVIIVCEGNSPGRGAVLPPDVRRLAPDIAILAVCDCDQRRAMWGNVVELPRNTTVEQLRDEVIAAAGQSRPMSRAAKYAPSSGNGIDLADR